MSDEIDASVLKELYVEQLEITLAMAQAQQSANAYNAKLSALWAEYGINPNEYDIDLKAGTMKGKDVS